jgi:hypothetical protein
MIGMFPIRFQTSLDAGGLVFAIGLGLACGLIFGAAPALQLSRIDVLRALRSSSRAAPQGRVRGTLMGVQAALAVVVLIAATLFYRSFSETRDMDPGFKREGVLLAAYDLSGRNVDSTGARLFAARLLERLHALPAVEGAAIASSVPLDIHGLPNRSFTLEGRARATNMNPSSTDRALGPDASACAFSWLGRPLPRPRALLRVFLLVSFGCLGYPVFRRRIGCQLLPLSQGRPSKHANRSPIQRHRAVLIRAPRETRPHHARPPFALHAHQPVGHGHPCPGG